MAKFKFDERKKRIAKRKLETGVPLDADEEAAELADKERLAKLLAAEPELVEPDGTTISLNFDGDLSPHSVACLEFNEVDFRFNLDHSIKVGLKETLENPTLKTLFRQHLKNTLCSENLEFFEMVRISFGALLESMLMYVILICLSLQVEELKRVPIGDPTVFDFSEQIYAKFIDPEADGLINMTGARWKHFQKSFKILLFFATFLVLKACPFSSL